MSYSVINYGNYMHNIFVNRGEYKNIMAKAIQNSTAQFQYFEGDAFYGVNEKEMPIRNAIIEEIKNNIDDSSMRRYRKNYLDQLGKKLEGKRVAFEKREQEIFNSIVNNNSQLKGFTPPSVGSSAQSKIQAWENLFLSFLINKFNNSGVIDFKKPEEALYCFLMSTELYDFLKNVYAIKTMLSRQKWEEVMTGSNKLYGKGKINKKTSKKRTKNLKKLEDMIVSTINEEIIKKDGKTIGKIEDYIFQGFDSALKGISFLRDDETKRNDYLRIVKTSYEEMKIKLISKTLNYKNFHDALKNWGQEIFQVINKKLEAISGNDEFLTEVKIGNDSVSFFVIESTQEVKSTKNLLQTTLTNTIANFIETYCKEGEKNRKNKNNGQNVGFLLTVMPYPTRTFSYGTARAAKRAINNQLIDIAIINFINKASLNENSKELDSNSILSGILGEAAAAIVLNKAGLRTALVGSQQQQYMDKTGQLKSTGQFFSDIQAGINGSQNLFGVNVKRYITDQYNFTLTSAQKEGLSLNSIYLRRYLTEEEILLLKFFQANYKLMKKYKVLPDNMYSIHGAARAVMDNHISSILRITAAGDLGNIVPNYIIAANGHYVPASCIFQYAKKRLVDDQYELYDITNAKAMTYQTVPPYDSKEEWSRETKIQNQIDINNLLLDNVVRDKEAMIFRFNEFTVNINQLLSL